MFRDSGFWLHKALKYIKDKNYDACLDSLDKSLNLDPENQQALSNKAGVLYSIQRFDISL